MHRDKVISKTDIPSGSKEWKTWGHSEQSTDHTVTFCPMLNAPGCANKNRAEKLNSRVGNSSTKANPTICLMKRKAEEEFDCTW